MNLRRNAFLGCAQLQVSLDSILKSAGSESSVATIGKVDVFPGGANVVPGKCVFTVEVRDPSSAIIGNLSSEIIARLSAICVDSNLTMEYRIMSDINSVGIKPYDDQN